VVVFCRLWPVQKNKIVFLSAHNIYACNPKYIIEEIIRRGLDLKPTFLGDLEKMKQLGLSDVPGEVRLVHRRPWPRFAFELSTAKIWVDNTTRNLVPKRPGQFFIQTWHGSLGIKKTVCRHREKVWEKHRLITDFCISNSAFETNSYRSSYWPGVRVLEYGHPRNDIFFPEAGLERIKAARSKVYAYFGLAPEEKIILHAPTFRERHFIKEVDREVFSPESLACYQLDPGLVLPVLAEKFGGNWRFLFRLHPGIREARRRNGFLTHPAAVDASDYHDMQELLAAAEVLISDYSSCLFDFLLTRRPAFVFAPDLAEYENDRGFYYSPRATPFPLAESPGELSRAILNFDPGRYQEAVTEFLAAKGCREDGRASGRVVDLLEKLVKNQGPAVP
jgi:CDP-glycerol glycerophosphotransferase